MEEKMQST